MKHLKFTSDMARLVRAGSKTEVRLMVDPATSAHLTMAPAVAGEVVEAVEALPYGKTAPIGLLRITSVGIERVDEISDASIAAEGFPTWAQFAAHWDSAYPGHPAMSAPLCWAIAFEVASHA